MKQLPESSFVRARQYVLANGRDLDRRLFEYHFESGNKEAVLETLAAYQNEDGGFGQALEPDLRTAASSAVATALGLHLLREVKATAGQPIVQRAINYLLDTFDDERQVWPIIPPEVEDAPHAPWWSYADSAQNFRGFLANPRACIVGHLHAYNTLVPAEFLSHITGSVVDHLATTPEDEISMHDLLCYLGLAEAENIPTDQSQIVLKKLATVAAKIVALAPEQWASYSLRPLDLASRPDAPLASSVESSSIDANLDYEIDQQLDDGSWSLAWSWGGLYPEVWAVAEREWKAAMIIIKLRVLRAHGRIENVQ